VSAALPTPDFPRDPGLQAERTALAWRRTGAAVLANALLILRSGIVNERPHVTAFAIVLLLAAGVLTVFGAWRGRHLLDVKGRVVPPALAPALTALVAVVACVAGIASVLR
jgi:uncharacterized membrane protein YidH (DUF202 family)